MSVKICVFLLSLLSASCWAGKPEWELAVVIKNEIKLLQSNGSVIESHSQPFTSLKALAYDSAREQFIVSDMDNTNDTIYTVHIKESEITNPIIQGLPGDVQGLAVDPIEDNLYWTDAINHTINYVSLESKTKESKTFFAFEEKQPHSVAIDVCKRYIYWTTLSKIPSIERARLDGTERQVLVNTHISSPEGITIDYKAQRLYWADSRIGTVGGVIESINFDGSDRRIVVERNTMMPFGVAVDEHAIYWTDTNNKALYKLMKHSQPDDEPEKLLEFEEMPMGIVANNDIVKEEPDCETLEKIVKEYKEQNGDLQGLYHLPKVTEEEKQQKECFNDGVLEGNRCNCRRGFTGEHCEISVCHNFCMHGDCYFSALGVPKCRCEQGFSGTRCQRNVCDGFCLNGGECLNYVTMTSPKCSCEDGFVGDRCEMRSDLCGVYCQEVVNNGFYVEKYELLCRCKDGESMALHNHTAAYLVSSQQQQTIIQAVGQPVFYLTVSLVFAGIVIVALVVYVRILQLRRPRVKKRFIVNKNITPLSYNAEPNARDHCVTIENCCNMNVCETPCFEPKEDRKKLLHDIEHEDF